MLGFLLMYKGRMALMISTFNNGSPIMANEKLTATIATREILVQTYLDYVNDYLTISTFAEHYGLTWEQGSRLIDLCREIHNTPHPDA